MEEFALGIASVFIFLIFLVTFFSRSFFSTLYSCPSVLDIELFVCLFVFSAPNLPFYTVSCGGGWNF